MATLPRDVSELYLAPVVLAVDARIEELSRLSVGELTRAVGLASDQPDSTRTLREEGLMRTIQIRIDCHGWAFEWDPRGLRLTHSGRTFVLGIPSVFLAYLSGVPMGASAN